MFFNEGPSKELMSLQHLHSVWALCLISFLHHTHPRVCSEGDERGGELRVGGWGKLPQVTPLEILYRTELHSVPFLFMRRSRTAWRAAAETTRRTAACWQAAQTLPPYPVWLMQPNEAKWRLIVIRTRDKEKGRMMNNAEPPETTVWAEEETQAASTKWANKTCDCSTGGNCFNDLLEIHTRPKKHINTANDHKKTEDTEYPCKSLVRRHFKHSVSSLRAPSIVKTARNTGLKREKEEK